MKRERKRVCRALGIGHWEFDVKFTRQSSAKSFRRVLDERKEEGPSGIRRWVFNAEFYSQQLDNLLMRVMGERAERKRASGIGRWVINIKFTHS
jgi:hypothetical protein